MKNDDEPISYEEFLAKLQAYDPFSERGFVEGFFSSRRPLVPNHLIRKGLSRQKAITAEIELYSDQSDPFGCFHPGSVVIMNDVSMIIKSVKSAAGNGCVRIILHLISVGDVGQADFSGGKVDFTMNGKPLPVTSFTIDLIN